MMKDLQYSQRFGSSTSQCCIYIRSSTYNSIIDHVLSTIIVFVSWTVNPVTIPPFSSPLHPFPLRMNLIYVGAYATE